MQNIKNTDTIYKNMRYELIAQLFDKLSQTSSRLKKTTHLAQFLQQITSEDIDSAVLLVQGRVFAEWDEHKLGVAGKLVFKALEQASGRSSDFVQKKFTQTGDIGETAYQLIASKQQQTLFSMPLTLNSVFEKLQKIALQQGSGSQDAKLALLNNLLTSATPLEAKFIVRTVIQDLRIGIASSTLRDAIYYAFYTESFSYNMDKNSIDWIANNQREQLLASIQRAYDFTADFTMVIKHVMAGDNLKDIQLQVGKPCKAMLARKEKSFQEAFTRTGFPVIIEYKYDGFRLQIHKNGSKVKLFTRRLDEVTTQFPDIVKAVREQVSASTCILDAEAVGYDPQTKQLRPFQHISRRIKRKHNISTLAKELPVTVTVFDILASSGTSHLELPLHKRLEKLSSIFTPIPYVIEHTHSITTSSQQEAMEFYDQALHNGQEGVMIKNFNAVYQPGGRVSAWIKMKPTMDELDLVIVGAERGNGKRSAWMTSFTLACKGSDGEYYEIGKVGTGMKEELGIDVSFPQLTSLLEPLIIAQKHKEVRVQPEVIVEVAYEEIQKSPSYSSGYALRFPRVLRLREDRSAEDIATIDDIREMYGEQ